MGAAPQFDDDALAALGRPALPARPERPERFGRTLRVAHDPLCSRRVDGPAADGYRCGECELIARTRADDIRRQRQLERARRTTLRRDEAGQLPGQMPLWWDF